METEKLLRQTLAQLELERRRIDKAIASIRELLNEPKQTQLPELVVPASTGSELKVIPRAIQIIRQEGRPMKTRELYDRLIADGVGITGVNSLYASLMREPRLRRCAPGTWDILRSNDQEENSTPMRRTRGRLNRRGASVPETHQT